ncbi:unnamed protein product [Mytilus edulis]|uniref:CRESS-DNA virus Rep endonuclease domain-containing protein n=1 Tax=Mytilus edulis TaxID=6550 RepID=A0A8S3S0U8_MYTED|nr:unnamed protein product [Mytilus edulis]
MDKKKTPHLQGYIGFKKAIAFNTIKKLIGERCHIENAKGNDQQNKEYCEKDGDVLCEFGKPQKQHDMTKQIKDAVKRKHEGASPSEMLEEFGGTCIRYKKHIDEQSVEINQHEIKLEMERKMEAATLRYWQQRLVLELPQHTERSVWWYWEEVGNVGKTWMSKWLVVMKNAMRFENGKSADIKHGYNGQDPVVFDLTRSAQDHINYEVIESVKNGIMYSTKYESKMKCYSPPKVIVFANAEPDKSKMSFDRWVVTKIDPIEPDWWSTLDNATMDQMFAVHHEETGEELPEIDMLNPNGYIRIKVNM